MTKLGTQVARPDTAMSQSKRCENAQYIGHHANGIPEHDEARSRDRLGQLEMEDPSSEIWPSLARGERRRRYAMCPVDPPPQGGQH